MSQWMEIIEMFHANNGTLTTSDFGKHPVLWAEYRRALCQMKDHGYAYTCEPIKRNLFRYVLIDEPISRVSASVHGMADDSSLAKPDGGMIQPPSAREKTRQEKAGSQKAGRAVEVREVTRPLRIEE